MKDIGKIINYLVEHKYDLTFNKSNNEIVIGVCNFPSWLYGNEENNPSDTQFICDDVVEFSDLVEDEFNANIMRDSRLFSNGVRYIEFDTTTNNETIKVIIQLWSFGK